MLRFLLRRLLQAVPVLVGVSIAVFLMIHLIPGDPAEMVAGQMATREDVENVRKALGLDQPLLQQYLQFAGRALTGDFGTSFRTGRPVSEEILARYGNTLLLGSVALLIAAVVGGLAGIVAAVNRFTWIDNLALALSILAISTPAFSLGLLLILAFAVWASVLPMTGFDSWQAVILPALTLSAASTAVICRIMRSSLVEVMDNQYVRTARAKGLREHLVIWRHGVRNALIPVVTVAGLQLGYLLGSAVVTETVFAWPGLGRLLVQSILARDFPVVQAAVLVVAVTFILVNIATDLLYALLDPRISAQ
ncbi:ABC transporter permease [Ramlibacter rhizophilus]|uniref:ABC transporter permease n=1 Tax=Ramlibacter rhizophilus TaxID=1781167 RepID=A0A4Z0C2F6_9BURK|nr:ABC transporter permease [Ramlibacter rhizophilus]TFZ05024.1 ABC transporter permease [Ramlibacter rhizophilus]